MTLTINQESPPLTTDQDGVIRVGGTRVTLGTVVAAFHQGASAEEIIQKYPSLSLADIYSVIGYYLRNRAEIDQVLDAAQAESQQVRTENEKRFPVAGIRARLIARQERD